MKTTSNNNQPLYICFHIGRGGHYNNPNHLSFVDEINFQELIGRAINDGDTLITEDYDEETDTMYTLPDEEWQLIDSGDNVVLQGRKEIEAMTGSLDYDTIYNTYYVTTANNLNEREKSVMVEAYNNGTYISDELSDYIKNNLI